MNMLMRGYNVFLQGGGGRVLGRLVVDERVDVVQVRLVGWGWGNRLQVGGGSQRVPATQSGAGMAQRCSYQQQTTHGALASHHSTP